MLVDTDALEKDLWLVLVRWGDRTRRERPAAVWRFNTDRPEGTP
ncbi:hypothetical protein [Natrinema longum]|nr:hypothetical protein [Natrinema longum]